MLVGKSDGCMPFGCDALEDGFGFGLGLPYNNGNAGLDDASLLAGYLLQRVAQKLGVVQTYVGDDGEQRCDNICTVEASTHAYLNDGDVNLLFGKIVKCQAYGHFKEGELEAFKHPAMAFYEVDNRILWYHVAIDAYALAEVDKMRRSVETHLIASLLQDGGKEVAD